jgi:hypothetical protein
MREGEGLMFMAFPLLQGLWLAMVCKRRFTFRDIRLCLRQWFQLYDDNITINAHENSLYAFQLWNNLWLQNRDTNTILFCRNVKDKQFDQKTELLLQKGMRPVYLILLTLS